MGEERCMQMQRARPSSDCWLDSDDIGADPG
jgi:hypothetical protein